MSESQSESQSAGPAPVPAPAPAGADQDPRGLVALRWVAAGLAVLWIAVIAVTFALRLTFPLELEWMEGGVLHQALRFQQGLPVYAKPSIEFIPFLYTPGYPALLAALGAVLPLGFTLGRAVSVFAFAGAGAGLWWITARAGKPRAHAVIAVGLLCAGYVFSFRWYDVVRADTTMLALVVWGLALFWQSGRERGTRRQALVAGLLMALAFWTKQTAAVFVFASGACGLVWARKHLATYVVAIGAPVLFGLYVGQWVTDGWLWTYIYELHQLHAFNDERFTKKTWGMFLHASPALALLVIAWVSTALARGVRRGRALGASPALAKAAWDGLRRADAVGYWGTLCAVGLVVSALGYSTQWAEPNAFMPGVCFGAAFVAVATPVGPGERLALGLIAAQLVFALVLEPRYQPIQSHGARAGLRDSYAWQDPWRTIPTRAQRERAAALRAELLSGASGEVFAPSRPWWNVLSGGAGHVGSMGINDVRPALRRRLRARLRQEVTGERYGVVWVEGSAPKWLGRTLRHKYRLDRRIAGDERVRPLTGYMSEAGMVTPYKAEQRRYVRK